MTCETFCHFRLLGLTGNGGPSQPLGGHFGGQSKQENHTSIKCFKKKRLERFQKSEEAIFGAIVRQHFGVCRYFGTAVVMQPCCNKGSPDAMVAVKDSCLLKFDRFLIPLLNWIFLSNPVMSKITFDIEEIGRASC